MNRLTKFTLLRSGLFTLGTGIVLMIIALSGLAISFSILNHPVKNTSYASSCGCNPPPDTHGWTDNMCFFRPKTSGCFMTYPGGYCDPNGDGSYQDADWDRGYYQYKADCGSPSPTQSAEPTLTTAPPAYSTPTVIPGPTNTGIPGVTTYPTPIETSTPYPTPTPSSAPIGCTMLQKNGDPNDKYDLVFMPVFYTDEASFIADVNETIAKINRSNLGSSILNKFNFLATTSLSENFSMKKCEINRRITPCWDFEKANTTMRSCNGDGYIIILYSTKTQEDEAKAFQELKDWGNWGGLTHDGREVMIFRSMLDSGIHELGHSIGQLDDEYTYKDPEGNFLQSSGNYSPSLNCSDSPSASENIPCTSWESRFPNTGCYAMCQYSDWYRPSTTSIMKYQYTTDSFNDPSIYGFERALKNFN